MIIKSIIRHKSHKMTGKTSGAPKPPPIGTAPVGTSILPSGTATSPPSAKAPMGAPGGLAKASTPQGTPSEGNGNAKPDKLNSKLKVDESVNTGSNAKGKSKEPPKVQTDGTDKNGSLKGPEKVSLQEELFGASTEPLNFYGSSRPATDTDLSEMETDNEELRNNKKRKQAPVPEHQSSDDDEGEQPPGEVLVDNLIQQNNETLEKTRSLNRSSKHKS